MNKLQIIGLTGRAASGKDTVADILVTHLGFTKLAFADALRREVCAAFGIGLHVLTDRETKELPMECLALKNCNDENFANTVARMFFTIEEKADVPMLSRPNSPRQIMQWWGTEYRRAEDPDYWTTALQNTIERASMDTNRIVVSDVRFDNEAAALFNYEKIGRAYSVCEIWKIRNARQDKFSPHELAHLSESGINPFYINFDIFNDHNIIDLVGPVLLHWLAMESAHNLATISQSRNHIDGACTTKPTTPT